MLFRSITSNTRVQWNTHSALPCPTGAGKYTYWQVYDQAETFCQGNQPVGPYFDDVADGQWRRYTYEYRPNSSVGARDGSARMWINGVKIGTSVRGTPFGPVTRTIVDAYAAHVDCDFVGQYLAHLE